MIISTKWVCIEQYFNGHVSGGMSYNSHTGFLRVPVDGYYYVYSQVLLEPTNQSQPTPALLGHKTVTCSCRTDCTCSMLEGSNNYILRQSDLVHSTSYSKKKVSNYHGGVFKLKANTYIGLLANLGDDSVRYSLTSYNSFMGAFLISEENPPSPTTGNPPCTTAVENPPSPTTAISENTHSPTNAFTSSSVSPSPTPS